MASRTPPAGCRPRGTGGRPFARLRQSLPVHGPEREAADHDLRGQRRDRRLAPRDHLVPAHLLFVRHPDLDVVEGLPLEQVTHRHLVAAGPQLIGERQHALGHAQGVMEQDHLGHRPSPQLGFRSIVDVYQDAMTAKRRYDVQGDRATQVGRRSSTQRRCGHSRQIRSLGAAGNLASSW
jgi:hypothetical protein